MGVSLWPSHRLDGFFVTHCLIWPRHIRKHSVGWMFSLSAWAVDRLSFSKVLISS